MAHTAINKSTVHTTRWDTDKEVEKKVLLIRVVSIYRRVLCEVCWHAYFHFGIKLIVEKKKKKNE